VTAAYPSASMADLGPRRAAVGDDILDSLALEDVVAALTNGGFTEGKREVTTSRRDLRPAGGVWQGLSTHTGSVASTIWRNRPAWAARDCVHHGRWRVVQGPPGPKHGR
jgi:hypothetical protein